MSISPWPQAQPVHCFTSSSVPQKPNPSSDSGCVNSRAGRAETREEKGVISEFLTDRSHALSCGDSGSSKLPRIWGSPVLAPSSLPSTFPFPYFPLQLLNVLMPLFLQRHSTLGAEIRLLKMEYVCFLF